MTTTFKIGDTVRIVSRQRTGTIDRISDGIAIIRPDDNVSHFTAAFLTDLEPNAMYTVKVRKWEDAVAMAVAKRGAYRTVDGGYVVIWEPKQQQKGA